MFQAERSSHSGHDVVLVLLEECFQAPGLLDGEVAGREQDQHASGQFLARCAGQVVGHGEDGLAAVVLQAVAPVGVRLQHHQFVARAGDDPADVVRVHLFDVGDQGEARLGLLPDGFVERTAAVAADEQGRDAAVHAVVEEVAVTQFGLRQVDDHDEPGGATASKRASSARIWSWASQTRS